MYVNFTSFAWSYFYSFWHIHIVLLPLICFGFFIPCLPRILYFFLFPSLFRKNEGSVFSVKTLLKNEEMLKHHYTKFHTVDPSIFSKNFLKLRTLVSQQKVLMMWIWQQNIFKTIHDFFRHQGGKSNPFEDKPINIKHSRNIRTCEITVSNHSGYYNFEDYEEIVNDSLKSVRSKFKSSGNIIKCGFCI